MHDYSIKRKGARGLRILFVGFVIFLTLTIVAVVTVRQLYTKNILPVSTSNHVRIVTVESGATAHEIALRLKKDNLIRATWAFETYVRINNYREKLQAGSYAISPSQSVSEIVDAMVQGKVSTDLFTILPAQRLDQIRQALIDAGFSASSVDAALIPAQYEGHPALVDKPVGASLEGYLYPESFQKTAETKPETIIRQSLDLMQEYLTPDVRAGLVKNGLTVHQGIILASIVEKEVSNPADRPVVAQVFLKRFGTGMPLGSDVTARYGAVIDGLRLPEDSAQADAIAIAHDSPYNTRVRTGLPAGPISNISDNSLRAVAFPSDTQYLYFVAGDDGVTHFSNTLAEHEAAAEQYCKKLCGR